MRRSLALVMFLALGSGLVAEPATVQVKQAPLYAKPSATSKFLGRLPLGTELVIVDTKPGWAQVKAGVQSGWLREQTFTTRVRDLKTGTDAGGVTSTEVSLAGKAFTDEVEVEYQKKNPGLDFLVLDAMEGYGVSDDELDRFLADGGLRPDGDRR